MNELLHMIIVWRRMSDCAAGKMLEDFLNHILMNMRQLTQHVPPKLVRLSGYYVS